jgi:hypothetical protein
MPAPSHEDYAFFQLQTDEHLQKNVHRVDIFVTRRARMYCILHMLWGGHGSKSIFVRIVHASTVHYSRNTLLRLDPRARAFRLMVASELGSLL